MSVDRKSWSCESRSGRQHRCRRRTRRRGTRAPAWRVGRPTTSGCATSAREAAAGNAELPPEDDAVEMASAAQLLVIPENSWVCPFYPAGRPPGSWVGPRDRVSQAGMIGTAD